MNVGITAKRSAIFLTLLFVMHLLPLDNYSNDTILQEQQVNNTSANNAHNVINTFNTTYNSKLIGTNMQISWDNYVYSKGADSSPTVLDFVQASDNSYLFLLCPGHSGQLIDNSTFTTYDSILLHINENMSFIKSFVFDGGGCTQSRENGMTNIILSPDNRKFHVLGSYYVNQNTGNSILNGSVTFPPLGTNKYGDYFVAISLNKDNFTVYNHKVISPILTTSSACDLKIYETTFSSDDGFGFIVELGHSQSRNTGCRSYSFGNVTITAATTPFYTHSQNIVIYANHNLDFYNSQQTSIVSLANNQNTPQPSSNNPPQFLSSGGWVLYKGNIQYSDKNNTNTGSLSSCEQNNFGRVLSDKNDGFYYLCGVSNQSTNSEDVSLRYFNINSSFTNEINLGTGDVDSRGMIMPTNDRIIISLSSSQTGLRLNNSQIFFGDFTLEINTSSGSIIRADSSFELEFAERVSESMYNGAIVETRPFYRKGQSIMIMETGTLSRLNSIVVLEIDSDSDDVPDRLDAYPTERTQNSDIDNDGYGDNQGGVNGDDCIYQAGNSTIDLLGCLDTDGDGYSDSNDKFINEPTQVFDRDGDGYGDNQSGIFGDACPSEYGESTRDSYGCPDADFDGWSDSFDTFDNDSSQWNDTDRDGYGDQLIGFQGDACPKLAGNSTKDRFGCLDTDGDGWSDNGDALPENPTQWIDRDGDGYGDNDSEEATEVDLFPSDGTQWNDTDGDGHGDNPYGTQGDWFPDDPTRWRDSDQDATADEDDAFPNDGTQQVDSDGDGYGDNIDGNRGDVFPNDPNEWKDSDGDGLGDNADMFPYDPTQTEDRDGDGMGDNPMGIGADKFPDDPTQWGDIDGDGYGDNQLGNNPDLFITDATQWADRDGDGYGDNPQGRLYDLFPDNPTQWEDADKDGLGDNQSGTDADPFLNDFDNDGFNDSIDILPKLASPGDLDADGCLDEVDAFPENGQECVDTDGDGIGNNGDSDDDGDGWTDADEERLGTDSLSASSKPVDSFEIVIPGTAVGLGAWDLIGIFGGVPLFAWISFGFATRNGRCARYEELLKEATSRDELEQIALRWEYSLMLRMLGPHQGIRLERIRAELDDKFENATYDETEIGYDQTNLVGNEGKEIPPINETSATPTKQTAATSTDDSGYEWYKQGDENWYRPAGSDDEWVKFQN